MADARQPSERQTPKIGSAEVAAGHGVGLRVSTPVDIVGVVEAPVDRFGENLPDREVRVSSARRAKMAARLTAGGSAWADPGDCPSVRGSTAAPRSGPIGGPLSSCTRPAVEAMRTDQRKPSRRGTDLELPSLPRAQSRVASARRWLAGVDGRVALLDPHLEVVDRHERPVAARLAGVGHGVAARAGA